MPEKTEDTKKPNPMIKILLGLVALGAAGAGSDAAGYQPDFAAMTDALKSLGILGVVVLIAYIHRYWYPLVTESNGHLRVLVERSDNEEARRVAADPAGRRSPELEAEAARVAAAAAAPMPRATTQPELAIVKPAKEY